MAVRVGSARSSFGNTSAGDQHGGLEVSAQDYYVHSKGWRVFRAKDARVRFLLAEGMRKACENNDIGYSQGTRLTLTENVKPFGYDPSKTTKKVNTDCSALVRCCCLYAGVSVGNFITSGEASKLLGTGAFTELKADRYTKQSAYLCAGDIMVTKTKGHTVIVLTSGPKCEDDVQEVSYTFGDRELKNGCEGDDVRELQGYLIEMGYSCGDWGADGEFGDCTEMAVVQFQREHEIAADGVVGEKTAAAIMKAIGEDDGHVQFTSVRMTGNAYVRMEPNTDGRKIGVAHKGLTFVYAGETSTDGWYRIIFGGSTGWVSGRYAVTEV